MPPDKRARVTLRDVAGRAGVSVTTASFVLSGRRDMRISAATQERVIQAARMLDYRRRLAPRSPLPIGAPVIGLISDVVATEPFAGEMLRGCIASATEHGHVVLMADTEGVGDLERSAVSVLLSRGVTRFIYASLGTVIRTVPDALRDLDIVLMNNADPSLDATSVIPDDSGAGRIAATTLVEAGHTTGIWLAGTVNPNGVAARRRLSGMRAGLRASGLGLAGHVQCDWWPDQARIAMEELFRTGWWERERPTAVIAINDRVAMGVYQAAATTGLRIPEDLSVISFDNSDLARWLEPGLSSLALPYFDMGRRTVDLLMTGDRKPRVHKLPMRLRPRGSVAQPR